MQIVAPNSDLICQAGALSKSLILGGLRNRAHIPIVNSNVAFDEGDTTLTDGSRLTTDRRDRTEAPEERGKIWGRGSWRRQPDLTKMMQGRRRTANCNSDDFLSGLIDVNDSTTFVRHINLLARFARLSAHIPIPIRIPIRVRSRGIIMPDIDDDAMHKQCHFKLAIVATVNFTMNYCTAIPLPSSLFLRFPKLRKIKGSTDCQL